MPGKSLCTKIRQSLPIGAEKKHFNPGMSYRWVGVTTVVGYFDRLLAEGFADLGGRFEARCFH
jgi:hypothetical protein